MSTLKRKRAQDSNGVLEPRQLESIDVDWANFASSVSYDDSVEILAVLVNQEVHLYDHRLRPRISSLRLTSDVNRFRALTAYGGSLHGVVEHSPGKYTYESWTMNGKAKFRAELPSQNASAYVSLLVDSKRIWVSVRHNIYQYSRQGIFEANIKEPEEYSYQTFQVCDDMIYTLTAGGRHISALSMDGKLFSESALPWETTSDICTHGKTMYTSLIMKPVIQATVVDPMCMFKFGRREYVVREIGQLVVSNNYLFVVTEWNRKISMYALQ